MQGKYSRKIKIKLFKEYWVQNNQLWFRNGDRVIINIAQDEALYIKKKDKKETHKFLMFSTKV